MEKKRVPQISVIIPAHNEEKYLERTLDSLRGQNFLDYETIIVCNGCTDQTESVAKRYDNQKTKILSIREANVSLARNKGAEIAIGKILVFLDADTLLENQALQTIINEFGSGHSVATTKTKPDIAKIKYHLALGLKNFYNSSGLYHGCSGVLICRKDDFHSVGGYPLFQVKEHRKLTIALKKTGQYKVVKTSAITSMRRFEQWGLINAGWYWVKQFTKNYISDLKKEKYEIVR
tara:strand:- start:130 stop:831 length:702 start_codon:yes stop_codon:yes gene_type:complete